MTEGINNELAAQASIVAQNLRAIACLPLRAMIQDSGQAETVGILYIDSRTRMHALTGLDQKILTKLAEEAGRAIEHLLMVEGLAERRKLDHDLALAHEAQRNLLPAVLPEFAPFGIHAFSRPTRHVGGDFYDFFPAGDSLGGVLADISGKGVAAALTAAMIQGAIVTEFRTTVAADQALSAINRLVWEKTPPSRFATLFLFTLARDGSGRYVGAGHNPAYLYRAATGEIEELVSRGVPFGMFRDTSYADVPFRMHPGDVLFVYSDGLTEAENAEGDMFGEERVIEILRREAAGGSRDLGRAVLREVEAFTRGAIPNDDLTFLAIHREE
jgi:serine phosphatase RsbU (regulator of sigma subunit)